MVEDEKAKKHVKDLLRQYKGNIISYFETNKINGKQFMSKKRGKFVAELKRHCNNTKLHVPLTQLHKTMSECDLSKINDIPKAYDVAKDDMKENPKKYNDCPALQKVKIVLHNFEKMTANLRRTKNVYQYKMNMYFSFYPGYSPVEFLNDLDHIIRHKLKHPQLCKKGISCIHMKRALRDRNSMQCRTLTRKKQFFNTNNQIDFVYISMLDRAHCLLTHSDDIDHKQMGKTIMNKLLEDDATKIRHLPYSTGTYMEYHTLKPLYQNLFDEIVRNKDNEITEDQFNSELEASKIFLKTDNVVNELRACKTDEKYGIKVNEPMHIEHVLCIKFYCNYTVLCNKFRGSYRKDKIEDTKDDIIRKHCNTFYWFGRFLTTAIEFWGEMPKISDYFYHGLSQRFVFYNFSTIYEMPTSTTWDINVAHNFCDAKGIVLQLSPKYTNEVNNSRCLNVTGLSEFEQEKEKLFAGMTVLSITNIYNPSKHAWKGYGEYVAAFLYFERIVEQTIHQKHHYNFGKIAKKDTTKQWLKRQRKYLVPLLKHQMNRNSTDSLLYDEKEDKTDDNDNNNDNKERIPSYICVLFEFFCDNKKDYIDLSCINDEIVMMHELLQQILFEDLRFDQYSHIPTEYKINSKNLKLIFPNLIEYKNHMGYWIYVGRRT